MEEEGGGGVLEALEVAQTDSRGRWDNGGTGTWTCGPSSCTYVNLIELKSILIKADSSVSRANGTGGCQHLFKCVCVCVCSNFMF